MYAVALPSALLQRYRAGLLAEHTDHGAPAALPDQQVLAASCGCERRQFFDAIYLFMQ